MLFRSFKERSISFEWTFEYICSRLTLVGRKFEIISLTFAIAGTLIPDLERPMPPFAFGAGLGESKSMGVELMVKGWRGEEKDVLVFSNMAK